MTGVVLGETWREGGDPASSLRAALEGRRVLITGATGFLGQALLERLLGTFDTLRVVLLLRGSSTDSAHERATHLLNKPVFSSLRSEVGDDGLRRAFDERVEVREADLSDGPPDLPGDIDVIFHCAATVAFDPPVDDAFRTNVVGTVNLYEAAQRSGSYPTLIHISTAYVAGMRKGVVEEATLPHDIDWRTELASALDARSVVERESRAPEQLDRFIKEAGAEHGRAGPQTAAADAERRRNDWVHSRLVDRGRARAQSLGWPDIYTLTKALGERAAEEIAGDLPLSIVRPSIIESALVHPYPGWIDGYKMADPIIVAFGRGTIPDFPGIPEGIIDIIPVDFVANAMLAAAARQPLNAVRYFHVSSGWRNPLSYRHLYEIVREYFRAHPLSKRDTGEIPVPDWRFAGRARVERMLKTADQALTSADRLLKHIPRSDRLRSAARTLDRNRRRLDFLKRYSDLYGSYAAGEVIYSDDRVVELNESLGSEDRTNFQFDVSQIDWHHYLFDVHCPMVTWPLRSPAPRRLDPVVSLRPAVEGVIAIFDLEGTIHGSNVVESYLWSRMARLPRTQWPREWQRLAVALPGLIAADKRDRGEFIRRFYRRYEGIRPEELELAVEEGVGELILQRTSPAAIRRIKEHRGLGHKTVLITGTLEVFVSPLAPLFDEIVGAKLALDVTGTHTGDLESPALVGEARAAWVRRMADEKKIDLSASYAYADSYSDLPLLAAVGNPVAVNPDLSLFRAARRNGWPVERWAPSAGTPRALFPEPLK